jgi:hypothetical protein
MAKNKIKAAGKWIEVADENVRHFWACGNDECKDNVGEITVGPDYYRENGTPVCGGCDCDMDYIRTEVKI